MTQKAQPDFPSVHPLEPLSPAELSRSVEILRDSDLISEAVRFSCALPVEPSKDVLDGYTNGTQFERELRLVGFDVAHKKSFDAHISLTRESVLNFDVIRDGAAPVNMMDLLRAIQIVKEDPGWQKAIQKRGIKDLSLVQIDPWPAGGFLPEEIPDGTRMLKAISFVREFPGDNGYARPIQGLIAYVDLENETVMRLDDHGVVPIPPESANYDANSVGELRKDLKPIEITQPEGPSFTTDGHAIQWQKWNLRISMHPIHGLVLHDVGYNDQGRIRKILHRASLSDMVVPYGDESPMHSWKHVFDASEYCIGNFANALKLGCDCLGEIHYFDSHFLGWDGIPVTIENAICMHEEDYGILWKHTDLHTGNVEVRRSRRLVISTIHTVGNYEYGFFWYLYLDGTIQMEVKLTGIVGVSAVAPGENSDTASLIAPQLASPNHQHLFSFRLDFEVDGRDNSVFEINAVPDPVSSKNPAGTVFRSIPTPLPSECDAMRNTHSESSRHWKITNPNVLNRLGQPVAYKLLPQGTPTLLARDGSVHSTRAGFARHNFWATAHNSRELSAASEFTNLNSREGGLPEYVKQNRSLENTDIVAWHTFGLTHVARPEDWPVMPVEYCGFSLVPVGFFDRNPALDLPPSKKCES